jgi:transcriptional regulator with XRE-family HTH domain
MRRPKPIFKKDEDRKLDKMSADMLRDLREEVGMSQKDLAGALGMTASYLCDIENGRRDLTLSRWEAALNAINKFANAMQQLP